MPEHMLMKPVFCGGELLGFVGAIGHVAEVGGMAPGSFASDATDVYQEGLRLPPVKLIEGEARTTDSGGSSSPTTGRPRTRGATSTP